MPCVATWIALVSLAQIAACAVAGLWGSISQDERWQDAKNDSKTSEWPLRVTAENINGGGKKRKQ